MIFNYSIVSLVGLVSDDSLDKTQRISYIIFQNQNCLHWPNNLYVLTKE